MAESPLIACLCPTYKRPECLRNAIACFGEQKYPSSKKMLCILDDAGIYQKAVNGIGDNCDGLVWIGSTTDRYPSVPAKFNKLAEFAPNADVYVVWEDDDIYLPWHLSCISASWRRGAKFIAPDVFLSNYNCEFGKHVVEHTGRGRMHGAWAYDGALFRECGGYDESGRLSFDQEMYRKMSALTVCDRPFDNLVRPSYVYRWGRSAYNGSQSGSESYEEFYAHLQALPCEPQKSFYPEFDLETKLIGRSLGLNLR